jgi:hypothetical protein
VDDLGRLSKQIVWVVGPLDGTREFVDGIPEWSISVGLVIDRTAVAGGVCNPATNELFLGGLNSGVTYNGRRAQPSARKDLDGAVVLASRQEYKRGEWAQFEGKQISVRQTGSVAYKLALVSAGLADAVAQPEVLEQQLAEAHQGLKQLPKAGRRQVSATDPESRFLSTREGWVLGYTADIAVSDDHFIVAARVTQQASDNASLLPMVDEMEQRCRQRPQKVTADSGFFSGAALRECSRRGIDLYVPDNNLRHEMTSGKPAGGIGRTAIRDPEHLRMREKLRSPAGRKMYQRRQAVVEPVIGILKVQRGMRRFRRRGLEMVNTQWVLAAIAYNIARLPSN